MLKKEVIEAEGRTFLTLNEGWMTHGDLYAFKDVGDKKWTINRSVGQWNCTLSSARDRIRRKVINEKIYPRKLLIEKI